MRPIMGILKLVADILFFLGHPIYRLLRFLVFKISQIKISPPLIPPRNKFRKRETIIYHSKPPYLKNFLKSVYPLTKFRFKVSNLKLICLLVIGFSGIYWYVFRGLPKPSALTTQPIPLTTHIRDRNGEELYKVYASQNRTLVKLGDVPLSLRQAIIAIEDAEFYQHAGFSLRGIFRASWRLLTHQSIEGGSTITQQLVKTALLSPERTFRRKVRELVLSVLVEMSYSKDQILEMYLNRVSFGGSAYGVEEAAQTYFKKSVRDLDLAQAALLAGLPASPTTYSPFGAHPELAKSRQKEVLRRMVSEGFTTWDQAETASNEELRFAPQITDIKAPHFVMYIKDLLAKKYGTQIVEQGGLDVTTSLDLSVQNLTQTAVSQEVAKVSYLHIGNGAALVTNPTTGEILAMVGSVNYFDSQNDGNFNVTLSPRQPGSSIKPLNYALAFTHGFTPASLIDDSPIIYKAPGQPDYSPVNYDGKYHGKVPLRTALASSYNIPAVKILAANGIENFIDFARKMGISTWTDSSRFGLSLTLGGGEVTMTDMATAYAVFANAGQKINLQPILSVRTATGKLLEEYKCCDSQTVLDPRIAYFISDILSDNSARAPAFGFNSDLNIPKVAVKTGTTNNLRDNWTIGYTTNRLVTVWVGNNDNSPMSYVASGVTGASPIWNRIVNELIKVSPAAGFTPPPNLIQVGICPLTGQLSCDGCPAKLEYFIPGTQPKNACSKEVIQTIESNRDKLLEGVSSQLP